MLQKKRFKWTRDVKGNLGRTMPLNEEAKDIVERALMEFKEVFERKPRRTDPVFLEKYLISEVDMERETLQAMKAANSPHELVYAYRMTGLIVTDRKLVSTKDLKEHDAAIKKFFELIETGEDPSELAFPETLEDFLIGNQKNILIIMGYFIEKHFNRRKKTSKASDFSEIEFFHAYAAVNFTRTIRSILLLLKKRMSYDAFNLLRVLYENYLSIEFLNFDSKNVDLFRALLGISIKTHIYSTNKNGTINKNKIIEISSGKETEVLSRWRMAMKLGTEQQELYDSLYRSFSSVVHSDIINVVNFVGRDGFDYLKDQHSIEILLSSLFLCFLFLNSLQTGSGCSKSLKTDLITGMGKAAFAIFATKMYVPKTADQRNNKVIYDFISRISAQHSELEKILRVLNLKSEL